MTYAPVGHLPVATQRWLATRLVRAQAFAHWLRDRVASTLAEHRQRRPPGAEAFSLHEHVWHLRDIEVEAYARRFHEVATQDDPFLPDLDGARLAIERDYRSLELDRGLREFLAARAANVAFLRALPPAALQRRGRMEGVGCLTLAQLVATWREHDRGHQTEIEQL